MGTIIKGHEDGLGLNELVIIAKDEDANGVPHRYDFSRLILENEKTANDHHGSQVGFLQFQKGPRNVEGSIPGLTTDAVIVALINHLSGFQAGPYKSRETALVITKLEEALHWSQARAKDRASRGVLGKNEA